MIDVSKFVVRIPLGVFNRRGPWFGTRPLTAEERRAEWHLRMGRERARNAMCPGVEDVVVRRKRRRRAKPDVCVVRLSRVVWRRPVRTRR